MRLKILSAIASKQDEGKEASKAIDGNPDTRWSAEGEGQWIEVGFDKPYRITEVALNCYHLDKEYRFGISGKKFTQKAGRHKEDMISYDLKDLNIIDNKLRIVGFGNNETDYNSIREIIVYGEELPPNPPPDDDPPVAVIHAPKEAVGGERVLLNGTNSLCETLKITQISGTKVVFLVSGAFRQSFRAPYVKTEETLGFRATAYKGSKSSSAEVWIKIKPLPT